MIFGKKEEKEKKSIRVSILTNEYLVNGLDDSDSSALSGAFDAEIDDPSGGCLVLTDARVQPMGNINTPTRTFDEWRMPSLTNVVAMFSDDPAAEDILLEMWEDYQTPFKVLIYSGTYIIEGTVYSEDEAPPDFMLLAFAPIEDLKITSQVDKKAEIIRAKWGVVNSMMMQGYNLEK